MRVRRIHITKWRHFENIELNLPDEAPIICLVGGNGTGKSQILELIAACAERVGLCPGHESSRGSPFEQTAEFEVQFFIAIDILPDLEAHVAQHVANGSHGANWDRTLTIRHHPGNGQTIAAGNVLAANGIDFANSVANVIRASSSVHYLSLDADRAYPKININVNELGQAYERDWDSSHKQSSFRTTRNLYEEWFRYLLGRENQHNNRFVQRIRLARERKEPDPIFVDQMEGYKVAIKTILPHLLFTGIDGPTRDIKFDSTGVALSFNQLSGGEREIAFLVGQIDRFLLRKGLLLVDEPELHLNYDLLRNWIGYLKSTVENGQIWFATHSLEVVEVTGIDATILLQRDPTTRLVKCAATLSSQPVLTTLSRAIGSPAFSISTLAFVLIEGEEAIGERERFRLLCDVQAHVRFIESGSCSAVIRRRNDLRDLASRSGQNLRIGGVVDRDWRGPAERKNLHEQGVFVLPVHEVENYFLHPPTLQELARTLGRNPDAVGPALRAIADKRAGAWIFANARSDKAVADLPPPSTECKTLVHSLEWNAFADAQRQCEAIAATEKALTQDARDLLVRHLVQRAGIYGRLRDSADEIWRRCEGKEVFRTLLHELGFTDEDAAERAITALWHREPRLLPPELVELRQYVANL